jgi:hypothetical protein
VFSFSSATPGRNTNTVSISIGSAPIEPSSPVTAISAPLAPLPNPSLPVPAPSTETPKSFSDSDEDPSETKLSPNGRPLLTSWSIFPPPEFKQVAATETLQRVLGRFAARKRALKLQAQRQLSATKIQRCYRRSKERQKIKKINAAKIIASNWKDFKQRQRTRLANSYGRPAHEVHRSATVLQSAVRMRIARNQAVAIAAELSEKVDMFNAYTILLQTTFRLQRDNKKKTRLMGLREMRTYAKTARTFRMFFSSESKSKQLQLKNMSLRVELAVLDRIIRTRAATVIQARWRGKLAQRMLLVLRLKQKSNELLVRRAFRGHLLRTLIAVKEQSSSEVNVATLSLFFSALGYFGGEDVTCVEDAHPELNFGGSSKSRDKDVGSPDGNRRLLPEKDNIEKNFEKVTRVEDSNETSMT